MKIIKDNPKSNQPTQFDYVLQFCLTQQKEHLLWGKNTLIIPDQVWEEYQISQI
ncbi:MAG: hypothetical protein II812_09205 [Prevotella sp.]|nr:hypothetical protein [Prevotella sp.]